MTDLIQLDVVGVPTAQGSKRAFINPRTGRAQMSEQTGDKLKNWRTDVKAAALEWIYERGHWSPMAGAVSVNIDFRFERPKSHYGTGRNATLLKDSAPDYPISKNVGDIEKLVRSTHDALTTAGIWQDDCLVVHTDIWKVYAAAGARPGARIIVRPAPSLRALNDGTHLEQGVLL